ncbi:glucocorticoid modulatory element-binding protein 1 isoform X2 [Acanthopagrus latus]|uniref:glucocorticoid modulatory element-binding protein 1 isoform X2 n=1 Tax=Acanthopagrus latus TaxID=8177 RepID=UPI00187CD6E2|nr:glucocorticoid modulatory element-binding protein 1 isoform X2 [Acanthopagrus latus]
MATTEEVTVSMGEVVMVKTDGEGDSDDPNKTQVILQLQPITTGDESAAETDAAVMAVEAQPEQTEGDDVEIGCPITCGDCKAVLLVKKFVCPGINVKCVKYEDQLISPKQFVHISGKATLKDWKRAIRMGGVMLRKMMDSGQLDFYQHSTLCTNTCRSTKFDLLINNARFPPDGTGLTTPTSSQAQVVLGNGGVVGEDRAEILTGKMDWSSVSLESADKKESNEISEDTLNFWKGIADVGLLGEVVTNISTELLELLNGVQQRREPAALQDTDSCLVEVAVLSNLAQVFGLLDSVKKILERRRQQTDPCQEQILSTITNLEVQLEEQRKQQQVRALLSCPQPAKNKTPTKRQTKRPRLQRPASTTTLLTSSINQQATLQSQQFTVLSPISLSSVGQPFTMAGLAQSSNTVTLLPACSQLFTRYMVTGDGKADTITLHPSSGLTLVGTTAMQDSSQLGTMMSPLELVQFSQQAGGAEVVPIEGQVVDGTMLVQQEVMQGEVEAGQEHTVIEINPAPMEQAVGVMELQLTGESGRDGTTMMVQSGMEVTMAAGEEETQVQEVQTEGVQGLQLDESGQLSGVQIVVIGETQEETKVK